MTTFTPAMCYQGQDFSFLGHNASNTGLTNSWLESRHHDKFFSQHYKDYKIITENPGCDINFANDIVKNIHETNPLAQAFFSKINIDYLQELIIQIIYKRSDCKWKISRQSDNELLTVMRSIYLQKAQHIPDKVLEEVGDLNKQVLLDVIPRIASMIEQHLGFQRDSGTTYDPFSRGELASNAGTKTTRGFSSLFI
jgi:hypothetical protein